MNDKRITIKTTFFVLLLVIAFAHGVVLSGFFNCRQRDGSIGEIDNRYDLEYADATETIGKLTEELERERNVNRELREHNINARTIARGLTETSEQNVRNLQDAIFLIGEIRKKIKVLEDFYHNSSPGSSSN